MPRAGQHRGGRRRPCPVELAVVDETGTVTASRRGVFPCAALPPVPAIAVADPGAIRIALGTAGLALFEMLAGAGLDQLRDPDQPVPLVLDCGPQELSVLPWELLRYPGGGHPFADHDAPASGGGCRSPAGSPPTSGCRSGSW